MAFDIEAVQSLYGINKVDRHAGNTHYVLGAHKYFEAIYDQGGVRDVIEYGGRKGVVIDLRAATLSHEKQSFEDRPYWAGGHPSYVRGDNSGLMPGPVYFGGIDNGKGGFTIARGVVIENAKSSSGNDLLVGNSAANLLDAGAGNDTLRSMGGSDTLVGGSGSDIYLVTGQEPTSIQDASGELDDVFFEAAKMTTSSGIERYTFTGNTRSEFHLKHDSIFEFNGVPYDGVLGISEPTASQGVDLYVERRYDPAESSQIILVEGKRDVIHIQEWDDTRNIAFLSTFEDDRDQFDISAVHVDRLIQSQEFFSEIFAMHANEEVGGPLIMLAAFNGNTFLSELTAVGTFESWHYDFEATVDIGSHYIS
jgi:hypothetical protein